MCENNNLSSSETVSEHVYTRGDGGGGGGWGGGGVDCGMTCTIIRSRKNVIFSICNIGLDMFYQRDYCS